MSAQRKLVLVDGSGYLYLDLFDHEGTVVHMVPNALAPDNRYAGGEAIQVGVEQENRRPGVRDYQVSEPYGPGMIFGVVVPTPLYDSPRPEVEQASAYLAVLERGLAEADATGPVVSAIRFIKISR